VDVFVDSGDGVFREQSVLGAVTGDSQHAAFAADGASTYALGVDEARLDDAFVKTQRLRGWGAFEEDLRGSLGAEEAADEVRGLADLIGSAIAEGGGGGGGGGGVGGVIWDSLNAIVENVTSPGVMVLETEVLAAGDDELDTDGDGLPDSYEDEIGTDPANADSDGDGLKDGDEWFDHSTNPVQADTDGDGLTDGQEIDRMTNPTEKDTDGDGFDDHEEHLAGTDPNNARDTPLQGEQRDYDPYPGSDSGQQRDDGGDGSEDDFQQDGGEGGGDGDGDGDDDDGGQEQQGFVDIPGGPCPGGICLRDAESGQWLSPAEGLLSDSIAELLSLGVQGVTAEECPFCCPCWWMTAPTQDAGDVQDTGRLRAVVAVAGDDVLLIVPAGQPVEVVFGGAQPAEAAPPAEPPAPSAPEPPAPEATDTPVAVPPAATPTQPPPALAPTATLVPVPPAATNTPAPPPPTATNTSVPPQPTATQPPADTKGPTIQNVEASPHQVFTSGTSTISASVSDPSGVSSVKVRWRYGSHKWWNETLDMHHIFGTSYNRQIPSSGGFPQFGTVQFEIVATDGVGNTSTAGGTVEVVMP
jgi:hypothetical protein